jgi:hypothetical protein
MAVPPINAWGATRIAYSVGKIAPQYTPSIWFDANVK